MGGYGSGRHFGAASKATTESRLQLDVRYLKKHNSLKPGTAGVLSWLSSNLEAGTIGFTVQQGRLILNYRYRFQERDLEDVQEIINLDRTYCNYGGERVWLLCPQCGQRVLVLYLNGKDFLCRHLTDVNYFSRPATIIIPGSPLPVKA